MENKPEQTLEELVKRILGNHEKTLYESWGESTGAIDLGMDEDEIVDELAAAIRSAGYIRLSKNQEAPKHPKEVV